MTFRVGQKVVCVIQPVGYFLTEVPQKGRLYTIRRFGMSDDLVVNEIVNREMLTEDTVTGEVGIYEPTFEWWHFEAIEETDISIFTEMLTKTGVDA